MDNLFKIIGQMFGKIICWPLNEGKKLYKQCTCNSKKGGRGRLIEVAVE